MSYTVRTTPFQYDKPVFAKVSDLNLSGKKYEKGQYVPWKWLGMDVKRISALYRQGLVHHNDELEAEREVKGKSVGDGLNELTIDQLHSLVKDLNAKLAAYPHYTDKKKTLNKCPTSKLKDRQIAFIRRWRSLNPKVEDYDPKSEQ